MKLAEGREDFHTLGWLDTQPDVGNVTRRGESNQR